MGGVKLHEGDWVSLNGTTGEVIRGSAELAPPAISGDLGKFMGWVDGFRRLKVLANADTPEDAGTFLSRKIMLALYCVVRVDSDGF